MQSKNSNIKASQTTIKAANYPRTNHRVIKIGKQWFIFGGVNQRGERIGEVLKIHSQTNRTDKVFTSNQLNLEGFAVFSYQQQVYLYGCDNNNEITNGLWLFEGSNFTPVEQTGDIPNHRQYFASCFILNRYLIIYGGVNQHRFLYDWFLLDCKKMSWMKLLVDFQIPKSTSHMISWFGNSGVLAISGYFSKTGKKLTYGLRFFHLEFLNPEINKYSLKVTRMKVSEGQNKSVQNTQQPVARNSPFIKFIARNTLLFIGGQTLQIRATNCNLFHDVWLLNTKTFKWKKLSFQTRAACHFDVTFDNFKLVIFGGQQSPREVSSVIESFNFEFILERQNGKVQNLCPNCLKLQFNRNKLQKVSSKGSTCSPTKYQQLKLDKNAKSSYKQGRVSIQQAQSFPGYLIWQMGNQIQSPVSAFALLVDNSFNVSASSIQISLKKIVDKSSLSDSKPEHARNNKLQFSHGFADLKEDAYSSGNRKKVNNYLIYQDNSSAFTLEEAEQIIYKLDWKRGISSIDAKIDQQQSIWKQYGVNLKLAAMKLGSSFLFITKTFNTQQIFVSFVSYKEIGENPYTKKPTCCLSYVISDKGKVQNQFVRNLIAKKVKQLSDEQNFQQIKDFTTKILIFNLSEATVQTLQRESAFQVASNIQNFHLNSPLASQRQKSFIQTRTLDQFQRYHCFLKHQYLKPYFGRGVKIQGVKVLFEDHIQKFHCDQIRGTIRPVRLGADQSFFKQVGLYYYFSDQNNLNMIGNHHSPSGTPVCSNSVISFNLNYHGPYDLPYVLIYHQNRLIAVKQFKDPVLCGYIQIPDQIQINIFKDRILKLRDNRKLQYFLKKKHKQLNTKAVQTQKILFVQNQQMFLKSQFRIQDKHDGLETNFKEEQCVRKLTKINQ